MKDKQSPAEKLSKLTAITIAQLLQRVSNRVPIVKTKIKQVAVVGDDGETQYKEVERITEKSEMSTGDIVRILEAAAKIIVVNNETDLFAQPELPFDSIDSVEQNKIAILDSLLKTNDPQLIKQIHDILDCTTQ